MLQFLFLFSCEKHSVSEGELRMNIDGQVVKSNEFHFFRKFRENDFDGRNKIGFSCNSGNYFISFIIKDIFLKEDYHQLNIGNKSKNIMYSGLVYASEMIYYKEQKILECKFSGTLIHQEKTMQIEHGYFKIHVQEW